MKSVRYRLCWLKIYNEYDIFVISGYANWCLLFIEYSNYELRCCVLANKDQTFPVRCHQPIQCCNLTWNNRPHKSNDKTHTHIYRCINILCSAHWPDKLLLLRCWPIISIHFVFRQWTLLMGQVARFHDIAIVFLLKICTNSHCFCCFLLLLLLFL